MKTLICTVGLPRSGKSTWAREQGLPIVNPDSIRLALHGQRFSTLAEPFVWAIAKVMVRALFHAGHDTIILDACHNTKKRRDEWRSEEWNTYFKIMDTSLDKQLIRCRDRAYVKGDHEIIPIIDRMASEHEPLQEDEPRW